MDSILPAKIIEELNLVNLLAGSNKNRVKTVRLRGEISQGLVARPERLLSADQQALTPDEMTAFLGVEKYEPSPIIIQAGTLLPLPSGVSLYDIEGADRFVDAVALLSELPVHISEKIEGMNFSITLSPDDVTFVSMRNNTIIPEEGSEHFFWKNARESGLLEKIRHIRNKIQESPALAAFQNQSVTLYGELFGAAVQGNIYQMKRQKVAAFDIRTDIGFLSASDFMRIASELEIETTPVLAHSIRLSDWLDGRTIAAASGGPSTLNPNARREGIVIKPMVERRWARGRLIIKQHCPLYLAKSKL